MLNERGLVQLGRGYEIYHRSAPERDVMCMGAGVTRQRLWNLSPLGGARGDVMNAGLV